MTMPQSQSAAVDLRTRYAMVLTLLLATTLRVYHIDFHGIWSDELASLDYARQDASAIIFGPDYDYHPPLYYLFLHYWLKLVSVSEVSIRIPSVVFGVLSVLMAYVLGSKLFRPYVGLVAAILVCLSPWHIVYSHVARMYTPLLFFSLCSTYFLFLFLEGKSKRDLFLYILTTVMALYLHNMAVFMVVGQNIYYACRWLSAGRGAGQAVSLVRWCLVQIAIVAIFSPWILVTLFVKLSQMQGNYWVDREPLHLYLGGIVFIFAGTTKYLATYFLAPWLCILALLGTVRAGRFGSGADPGRSERAFFRAPGRTGLFWALLVVPPVLTAIASQFMQPFFVPRSFVASSVALFMLAAAGIATLPARHRPLVLAVTLAAAAAVLSQSFVDKVERGYRQSVLAVLGRAAPNDAIIIDKPSGTYYLRHLTDRTDLRLGDAPDVVARDRQIISRHCARFADNRIWTIRASRKPAWPKLTELLTSSGLQVIDTIAIGHKSTIDVLACRHPR